MKHAMISGPTGAIGVALIKNLIADGIRVTALVRPGSQRVSNILDSPLVEVVELDISDICKYAADISSSDNDSTESTGIVSKDVDFSDGKGDIDCNKENTDSSRSVKKHELDMSDHIDIFYHLGWAGTTGSGRDDCYMQLDNVRYTLDAVGLASRLGAKAFVGVGSQAEYGRDATPKWQPFHTRPITQYGAAKLSAGHMSRVYANDLGMAHAWVRVFSVFGPYDRSLIYYVIDKLLRGEHVPLTAGRQMWDYLYSDDAGRALKLLGLAMCGDIDVRDAPAYKPDKYIPMTSDRFGAVYDLCSGETRFLHEYITELCGVVKEFSDKADESLLGFGEVEYGKKQTMSMYANTQNLYHDVKFEPRYSFADGIRETVRYVMGDMV